MEDDLIKYIRSSFNYRVDIDAHNFMDKAKLQLLQKDNYAVYFIPMERYSPKFKELEKEYQNLTLKAFKAWSKVLHNKIKFKQVENEWESDIKVFFLAKSITTLGKQYQEMIVAGAFNNHIFHIKGKLCIAIGIRDYKNNKIDYDKVYHVMLHEIGHIFGLGHSPNKHDIMCRTAKEYTIEPSVNDIFVLRLIYHIGEKSFEKSKKYIEACVLKFKEFKKKEKNNKLINTHSIQEVKPKVPEINKRDLLDELNSISDLKKYKMAIEQLQITKPDSN